MNLNEIFEKLIITLFCLGISLVISLAIIFQFVVHLYKG